MKGNNFLECDVDRFRTRFYREDFTASSAKSVSRRMEILAIGINTIVNAPRQRKPPRRR
jgi:hypothetical protein